VEYVEPEHKSSQTLAQRQAALVAGLWQIQPTVVGFDATQIQATAKVLRHKRARSAVKAWPSLGAALGDSYALAFDAFTRDQPGPEADPLSEAMAFANWLAEHRRFPESCRMEWLMMELCYKLTPIGVRPRSGPAIRLRMARRPWRLIWGARIPGYGIRCGSLPTGSTDVHD
jgi:hypothetical protein